MRNDVVVLGNRRLRVADRACPSNSISLLIKTFGTTEENKMLANNVSMSGFLVSSVNFRNLPYQINTLLEISVSFKKHDGNVKLLRLVGKVVRKLTNGKEQQFGIQIVSTEDDGEKEWCDFVAELLFIENKKQAS